VPLNPNQSPQEQHPMLIIRIMTSDLVGSVLTELFGDAFAGNSKLKPWYGERRHTADSHVQRHSCLRRVANGQIS